MFIFFKKRKLIAEYLKIKFLNYDTISKINSNKNALLVFHHLGLGDILILNGLINKLSEYNEKIYILIRADYFHSASFLYIFNPKVELLPVVNLFEAEKIFNQTKINKIKIGFENLKYDSKNNFDKQFYNQLNIDFKERWNSFKLVRNDFRESYIMSKLNIPKKYIFLHEDKSRNFEINRSFIVNKNLPIITPDPSITPVIFDWLKVIENAEEIHCIDSSFKVMIDTILEQRENLFLHLRLKNGKKKDNFVSSNRLSWKLID